MSLNDNIDRLFGTKLGRDLQAALAADLWDTTVPTWLLRDAHMATYRRCRAHLEKHAADLNESGVRLLSRAAFASFLDAREVDRG